MTSDSDLNIWINDLAIILVLRSGNVLTRQNLNVQLHPRELLRIEDTSGWRIFVPSLS